MSLHNTYKRNLIKLMNLICRPLFPKRADLLLIKLDAIGDYVLWQDQLRAYRAHYAGKRVVLLCNKLVKSIAQQDSFFSEVITCTPNDFVEHVSAHWKILRLLRQYKFDYLISPVFSRVYAIDQIVKESIAKHKIGYYGNLCNISETRRQKGNKAYDLLIPAPEAEESEFWINAHFIHQLYHESFHPQLPTLNFLSFKEIPLLADVSSYCVFSISASYDARAWAVERFAQVAEAVPDSFKIVLLGHGALDRQKADKFLQHLGDLSDRVINLTDKTSLLDYINIVRNSAFVVGNDSSAVHIAAAMRVPSVCVAPGAHYNRFVPYPKSLPEAFYHPRVVASVMPCFNCNYQCVHPIVEQLECIRRVETGPVIVELKKLLQEISAR